MLTITMLTTITGPDRPKTVFEEVLKTSSSLLAAVGRPGAPHTRARPDLNVWSGTVRP